MALDVGEEAHPLLAAPVAYGGGERGEQDVLDAGAVRLNGPGQQRPGVLGVEDDGAVPGLADRAEVARRESRERVRGVHHLTPHRQFVVAPGGLPVQGVAPGAERRRYGGGFGEPPRADVLGRSGEVVQQDAPGDPVHHEVVHDQQESARARSGRQIGAGAHHPSGGGVERGGQFGDLRRQLLLAQPVLARPQFEYVRRADAVLRRHLEGPGVEVDPGAQHVVPSEHGGEQRL